MYVDFKKFFLFNVFVNPKCNIYYHVTCIETSGVISKYIYLTM